MNYDPLNRELAGVITPVFPASFDEIASQLRAQDSRGWIGKLATAMTGARPPSQTGFTKGSAEYKAASREYNTARRQIERHATGQYKSFSAAGEARLKEIGQTLSPIRKDVPGAGLNVVLTFHAPADRGHAPRERTASIHLSSQQAFSYVNGGGQPSYADLFDAWFDGGGDAYGEGGDYEVDIVGVEVYAA